MRVISGFARGHKLTTIDGDGIRPTSDRTKEAVFSSLGEGIRQSFFLDLFSGSGGIGIEAMSRGAKYVAFVEENPEHAEIIRNNIRHIEKALPEAEYDLICRPASEALQFFSNSGKKFDYIYMDPPFHQGLWVSALKAIKTGRVLNKGGIVIIEMARTESRPNSEFFNILKDKHYGKTAVYYMEEI